MRKLAELLYLISDECNVERIKLIGKNAIAVWERKDFLKTGEYNGKLTYYKNKQSFKGLIV